MGSEFDDLLGDDEKVSREPVWTIGEALTFCKELREDVLPIGFSVGLTGGCLYRGHSFKDIDVILYPLKKPSAFDVHSLRDALLSSGKLKCKFNRTQMKDNWRYKGVADDKWVEVWDFNGRRVDFFFME
jgi:hypothetical protein